MKITINRSRKELWITEAEASQAGRVGFYFACNHPDLTQQRWVIKQEPSISFQDNLLLEHYEIKVITNGGGEIASFIKNPPKENHCPTCTCERTGCCQ